MSTDTRTDQSRNEFVQALMAGFSKMLDTKLGAVRQELNELGAIRQELNEFKMEMQKEIGAIYDKVLYVRMTFDYNLHSFFVS